MGNQYIKTISLSKTGGLLGKVSFGVGVLADGIGVYNYYHDPNGPNAVSPGKAGVDTGMGLIGLTGFGTLPAIFYFGIDAFYPGGIEAATKNATPLYNEMNKPNPAPYQLMGGMP